MNSRVFAHLPVATALVWIWGCGDAPVPGTDSRPLSAPTSPSASPAPAAQSLSIRGFTHAGDGSVLPGVDVSLDDGIVIELPTNPIMCSVSASDGSFMVTGATANGTATLTFRKDGFASTVRPIELQAWDVVLPSSENVLLADPLVFAGTPADPDKGQIAFAVSTTGSVPAPQMSASLFGYLVLGDGADGPAGPPVYFDDKGAPAPGIAAGTSGGFVNAAPGLYMITFHAPSGSCIPNPLSDYAATQDTSGDIAILVPVIKGFVTAPVGIGWTGDVP